MLREIKKKLNFKTLKPLIYNEDLRDAYTENSVTGNRLVGKTVLVTGGNGGIGTAIALRFIGEGCAVIISGRNEDKLKSTLNYLKKKNPKGNIEYIIMDQCDDDSIRQGVQNLSERTKGIDILINNAGICTDVDKKRMFSKVTKNEFDNVWNTNFNGTVKLTNFIAQHMDKNGTEGGIINIASICAEFRNFQYTPYGMSKAAIIEYSKKLSEKYSKITVNVIEPGSVATNMGNLKLGDNVAKNCNVLHRSALPEEIASLTAFLAGGFGRYLTKEGIIASACEIL